MGELVLLKDEDLTRRKWLFGCIVEVNPGIDGVVRIVELRTKDSIHTRSVVKILKLRENDSIRGGSNVGDAS